MEEVIHKDLQRDLIKYYTKNHSKIPLAPLVEENDAPLLQLYVPPPIQAIDVNQKYGHFRRSPVKKPVSSYRELLFLNSANSFKNIYVTANAGVGKTTFCQHICMAWCQAHERNPSLIDKFRREDIQAMEFYEFVFLITLRDVDKSLCDIDQFVKSFVKYNLPNENPYWEFIDRILNTKTCLIILDGLDDWNHPLTICCRSHSENDIPHTKCWNDCTILTTTRPWKFDEIRISSKNADRHIEICELNDTSSKKLVSNAIEILNMSSTEKQQNDLILEFYEQIRLQNLESICNIPYISMQMVCVWCEKQYIGKSKCEIYTNMIELTLERGIQKHGQGHISGITEINPDFPHCISVRPVFRKYGSLLLKLGKAAFHTLFGGQGQMSLVFDKTFALQFLDLEEDLTFCLNCGLLSQNKGYESLSRRQSNVCFQHKSMHEYFAALFIQSELEAEETNEMLCKVCSTPSSIIQMSNVFILFSGLNPVLCGRILKRLIRIASEDKFVQTFRSNFEVMGFQELYYNTIFALQSLQVNCISEGMDINDYTFEDVIIDEKSEGDPYMYAFEHVLSNNACNVKSLCILVNDSAKEFKEHILNKLNLKSTRSLVKLVLWTSATQEDVMQLLLQNKTTLTCVCLGTSFKKRNHSFGNQIQLSTKFIEAIKSISTLQNLILAHFEMDHEEMDAIATIVSECKFMTHVGMIHLDCRTHRKSCSGVKLDLSHQENIRRLYVFNVPLSEIIIKPEVLEECETGPLSVFPSLLDQMPSSLQRFYCIGILDNHIPMLLEKIPNLTQLKVLYLKDIKLNDQRIYLSLAMRNIEWVDLWEVTMSSSVLRNLITSISELPQFVNVKIEDCEVTPDEEFEEIKMKILSSKEFLVILNGRNELGRSEFRFQTVKEHL